jgi:hypothetical protein
VAGAEVRIGPNDHPIKNQPELTGRQRQVVEHYKPEIRTAVRRLGSRSRAAEEEEERRKAAKNQPCD